MSDYNYSNEKNNGPINNMDIEDLQGQDLPHWAPSSQPGCSRHFDSVESGYTIPLTTKLSADQIDTIAENILQAITKLLGSINHNNIVDAIKRNLRLGKNKLRLLDLVPGDFNLERNRKRPNSKSISDVTMKKPRKSTASQSSKVLAGFLRGHAVKISNFPSDPLHVTPYESGAISPKPSTPINSFQEQRAAQATIHFTGDHSATLTRHPPVHIPATVTSYSYQPEGLIPPIPLPAGRSDVKPATFTGKEGAKITEIDQPVLADIAILLGYREEQFQLDNHVINLDPPTTPSSGNKVCIEIYQKLRAMFPDLDREYIKTFCPEEWETGISHEIQVSSIVETILMNNNSWVYHDNPNNFQDEAAEDDDLAPKVDDIYEYLTGIFPNAEPHYLRSAAENFKDENDIEAFVEEKLRSNDYPTLEQYLAKIKVTEEQQRYTKNFNVEQFLSLIPDPFKHFEDGQRKCKFNLIVFEFLKNMFNRVRINAISRIYRRCNYNMSISARELRQSRDFIVTPRRSIEIHSTEDISLLQEMAFVRHHEEIRKHMEAVKQREMEEFNSLKAAGSLLTCQCCYDDECMPSKCSTCDKAHVFCNSCVVKGTDSKLGDGETHVPCFLNCGSEFSIPTLQKVLPPTKFSILLKKRQAAEVMAAGLEGLVSCPFCHFASIPPEEDKVFKCLNPECMKESCINCKEPNHVPYKCGELDKKDKARKYIEEKMTQALTRTCYQCKKAFFKEEGCNKMKCPCGAMMCYICNKPAKNYNHFRGQGSTETNKCPLWSDNMRLNAETVRKVEEDARKEILRQDPTLNIDTTRLAPDLPPPTDGPFSDIPGTQNIIEVLAARVLNNDRLLL